MRAVLAPTVIFSSLFSVEKIIKYINDQSFSNIDNNLTQCDA